MENYNELETGEEDGVVFVEYGEVKFEGARADTVAVIPGGAMEEGRQGPGEEWAEVVVQESGGEVLTEVRTGPESVSVTFERQEVY